MAAGMIGEQRMQGSIDQIESIVYFKSTYDLLKKEKFRWSVGSETVA